MIGQALGLSRWTKELGNPCFTSTWTKRQKDSTTSCEDPPTAKPACHWMAWWERFFKEANLRFLLLFPSQNLQWKAAGVACHLVRAEKCYHHSGWRMAMSQSRLWKRELHLEHRMQSVYAPEIESFFPPPFPAPGSDAGQSIPGSFQGERGWFMDQSVPGRIFRGG